ncbi:MAG: cytochrome c biogenesis protein CcdA [Streptosporangiales bacterium]|nr:cytochrome c biogenesis protein CcdA [Streptosporangiales bacterium]
MNTAPYAIALAAGMLAAVNPCGFALLPTYLALLIADTTPRHPSHSGAQARAIGRALAATGAMTAGFVAVFTGFGLVVAPLALSVERYLPWVTVAIGIALVGLGGWLLAGREVVLLVPKPRPGRPARSLRWAAAYGVTYAITSLSCTVAPFLALTTAALRSGSIAAGVAVFVAYAAGMGIIVGVLGLSAALARDGLAARLRRALPYVNRAGGALLVLAGAYVAYYGWYEIRVLSGSNEAAEDAVVGTATQIQSALTRWLDTLGPGPVAAAFALVIVIAFLLALRRTRHHSREDREDREDRDDQEGREGTAGKIAGIRR